jgi:hypothetical protein
LETAGLIQTRSELAAIKSELAELRNREQV